MADPGQPAAPAVPDGQPTKNETNEHSFGEGEGFMMGGSIGDGALPEDLQHQQLLRSQQFHQPSVPNTPSGRVQPTPMNTPYDGLVPTSGAPQGVSSPGYPQPQSNVGGAPTMASSAGSVSGGSSYAARSAMLLERHQQQPQLQPTIVVSPNAGPVSASQPSPYHNQHFQQPQLHSALASSSIMTSPYRPNSSSSSNSYMAQSPAGMSYTQTSQTMVHPQQAQSPMMQQQPPVPFQAQQGIMSQYAQQVSNNQGSQNHHQQPQPPSQTAPQPNMVAPGPSVMTSRQSAGGGGSYAARSAALNSTQSQSTQQLASNNMMGSGVYGANQQPQIQGQHSYGMPGATAPSSMAESQQSQQFHQTQVQSTGIASQQTTQQYQHEHQQRVPPHMLGQESPAEQAQQARLLTDATRKVQEHAYYMKQAMERQDLPSVLERAANMVGELGEHAHAHRNAPGSVPPVPGTPGAGTGRATLNPKNYYELHLRALDDLPALEDYLKNLSDQGKLPAAAGHQAPSVAGAPSAKAHYSMRELYDIVQYCPSVLSRLYLQICAASALISSREVGAKWVMNEIMQAVKCVQNPVRGLFLRHYLLQAFRDKLPDTPAPTDTEEATDEQQAQPNSRVAREPIDESEVGNVKDSYEFILANFMEMNKLWVRIQNLPGDGKSREIRRRRERERNELRILVGTNLIRLSQLECVTSKIYGEKILPKILEHIVVCNDPLAQAYLMDCITQVFPDEYHLETMPILLGVCPRLRDKVNIRTILQSLMDRLANYLADEELLDEQDTNSVKLNLATESFQMFDDCVQKVYNARGPKLSAKEAIRLQTALLSFTMKCHNGNLSQITRSLGACVQALNQARTTFTVTSDGSMATTVSSMPLDAAATTELEKLLSIPMDSLALGVLKLDHFAELIAFLPWSNRRQVALKLLESIINVGTSPKSMDEIEEMFEVLNPVLRDERVWLQQEQTNSTGQMTQMTGSLDVGNSASTRTHGSYAMMSTSAEDLRVHNALVCKLIHLLDHDNTDMVFEMLNVTGRYLSTGGPERTSHTYVVLVHASLNLVKRIVAEQRAASNKPSNDSQTAVGAKPEGVSDTKEELEEDSESASKSSGGTGAGTNNESRDIVKDEGKKEQKKVVGGEIKDDETDGIVPTESSNKDANRSMEEIAPAPAPTDAPPVPPEDTDGDAVEKSVKPRTVFVFIQQTIATVGASSPETGIKLYHEAAQWAAQLIDSNNPASRDEFSPIVQELLAQSFSLYEEKPGNYKYQSRCIASMVSALLACNTGLEKEHYEKLILRTTTHAAKSLRKEDQCELITLCSNLFYYVNAAGEVQYANPQRCLECLQRALKLADACVASNPSNLCLFVDLLEQYVYFFDSGNPSISSKYIKGLFALVKDHCSVVDSSTAAIVQAKDHFAEIVKLVKSRKVVEATSARYSDVDLGDL